MFQLRWSKPIMASSDSQIWLFFSCPAHFDIKRRRPTIISFWRIPSHRASQGACPDAPKAPKINRRERDVYLNEKIFVILTSLNSPSRPIRQRFGTPKKKYQVSTKAKTERRTSFCCFWKTIIHFTPPAINGPLTDQSRLTKWQEPTVSKNITGLSNSSTTTDRHFKSVSLRPDRFSLTTRYKIKFN